MMVLLIISYPINLSFGQNNQNISQADSAINNGNIEKNTTEQNTLNQDSKQLIDNIENVSKQIQDLNNSILLNEIRDDLTTTLLGNKSTSLMLNDEEEENTDKALQSFKNNEIFSLQSDEILIEGVAEEENEFINEKSYIYLASILFISDKNWVVWVNDKKITSQENDKKNDIFISSIQKNMASIIWNISPSKLRVLIGEKAEEFSSKINKNGLIEVKFNLHPNQSYILSSEKIIEGKLANDEKINENNN
jgi:hypothetical protein